MSDRLWERIRLVMALLVLAATVYVGVLGVIANDTIQLVWAFLGVIVAALVWTGP